MKVAYQGVPGSFSHRAAQLFSRQAGIGEEFEAVSCTSFEDVHLKLKLSEADFGALPLENSSVGSITANYDLLWKNPLSIVSEVLVAVQHNLIGLAGTNIQGLREIYSHPMALAQCKKFLDALPKTKAISFWDTGASVLHVKESGDHGIAAIASEAAAKESGMAILAGRIEDHAGNHTRFGITALNDSMARDTIFERLMANRVLVKLSYAAELVHESGTLARLLQALADEGANLTKIESRPIPEQPWHYRFFFDMEITRARETRVTEAIAKYSVHSKMLGRYPMWKQGQEHFKEEHAQAQQESYVRADGMLYPVNL